jgi:hypothetical protein
MSLLQLNCKKLHKRQKDKNRVWFLWDSSRILKMENKLIIANFFF